MTGSSVKDFPWGGQFPRMQSGAGRPGHQAHRMALQAVRKFSWSKTHQNRILSRLIFSSRAPATLSSHRSVVVCIIRERKPSPFLLRPQAPKPVAGQILPAGFPFPGPWWARAPWKVWGRNSQLAAGALLTSPIQACSSFPRFWVGPHGWLKGEIAHR